MTRLRKSHIRQILMLILLFIYFLLWKSSGWSQGIITAEKISIHVMLLWDRNAEADVDSYRVHVIYDADTLKAMTADTSLHVFIPDSMKYDTVRAFVTAIDTAGNESGPSKQIELVPFMMSVDVHSDSLRRIDIEDLREFLRRYREYFGRSSWRTSP